MLRSSTIFEQTLSKPVLIFWPFLISIFFNSLKLKVLIHKTIIWFKRFFFFFLHCRQFRPLYEEGFFPLHGNKHRKAIDSETDISGKAGSVSSISAASLFTWVTGVKGQCRAGPSELRHKPFFTVIGWDRPVTPGGLRGISPSPSSENACWLNGLRIWCLSRTLPSLHFYQIFIMLSYSTLTVWQNSIMWTRSASNCNTNCEITFTRKVGKHGNKQNVHCSWNFLSHP